MRLIEAITIQSELDPWLSLAALSRYSGLSVRTLRAYLTDPHRPLPHYRMKEPRVKKFKYKLHKDGEDVVVERPRTVTGKILVRRSDFDRWMQAFKYAPPLDGLVDEVVADLRRQSHGQPKRNDPRDMPPRGSPVERG